MNNKSDKKKAYAKILEVFKKAKWKNSHCNYSCGDFGISFHEGDPFNWESFSIYYKNNLVTFLSIFQKWRLKRLFKKSLKNEQRRAQKERDNENIKTILKD